MYQPVGSQLDATVSDVVKALVAEQQPVPRLIPQRSLRYLAARRTESQLGALQPHVHCGRQSDVIRLRLVLSIVLVHPALHNVHIRLNLCYLRNPIELLEVSFYLKRGHCIILSWGKSLGGLKSLNVTGPVISISLAFRIKRMEGKG